MRCRGGCGCRCRCCWPALRGTAAVPPQPALSVTEARAPLQRPAGQSAGGGFDLAVRIGSPADTGSLRARALGEHGMVLCAAAYLRQQPAPQTIAGLNEHRTLGYLHNGQLQKWQLYDPQQGEVRFSPQTWLIQMILPPSRRQCSRGWASPAAGLAGGAGACRWDIAAGVGAQRSGAFRHPRGMAGGAVAAAKTRAAIDALREGLPLPQHPVSAERNNRHLWRRRFSDSVQATGALYAVASATRPSGTGGTAVQRAAGDTQHLRRPADVAVDPGVVSTINCSSWACNPRAATAQARRDTPPAARRASACRPHRREPALPSGRSAAGVRFPATAAG